MRTEYIACDSATQIGQSTQGHLAVTNLDANTGYIYIGDSRVSSTNYFIRLVPGDVYEFIHIQEFDCFVINSVAAERARVTTWV